MSDQHKAKVQSQFGSSAESYATSQIHAKGESLEILLELVKPQSSWQTLDVGTGAGHTALTFAPYVAHITATDLTESMLTQVAKLAADRGVTNIKIQLADAEALPFEDDSFDLLTCRLAFHHFPNPQQALDEFFRVLKPGGSLGLADNITVPAKQGADYYNAYEKLRDPSHNWVYSLVRLHMMIDKTGFEVLAARELSKVLEFQKWADRQHVSEADKAKLLEMMRDIPKSLKPLFAPRWADNTLYFNLWEAVIAAKKGFKNENS